MLAECLEIFFDVSSSALSVTTAPSKAPHLGQGLLALGILQIFIICSRWHMA